MLAPAAAHAESAAPNSAWLGLTPARGRGRGAPGSAESPTNAAPPTATTVAPASAAEAASAAWRSSATSNVGA